VGLQSALWGGPGGKQSGNAQLELRQFMFVGWGFLRVFSVFATTQVLFDTSRMEIVIARVFCAFSLLFCEFSPKPNNLSACLAIFFLEKLG
jgi:hypothetical protein